MIFLNDFFNSLIYIWSYTFIYNITLLLLFLTLFQVVNTNLLVTYSLNNLGKSNYFTKIILLSIFSMAGIPPFLGFFSKLFILNLVVNMNFFIMFFFFFILLFLGLYFYIQNVRFLNSTNPHLYPFIYDKNLRTSTNYVYISLFLAIFLIVGPFFVDELLILFKWILL